MTIAPQLPDDALMPTDEAAKLLSVSPATLRKWRRTEGAGPPFVRISAGFVAYRLKELREWVDARVVH